MSLTGGICGTCAVRRRSIEWRWETFAAALSQQGSEAGGSLTREMPGRGASGPYKARTCQHCQMVRVRRARQRGIREEPVCEAS